jgi:hypothetical protein
MNELNQVSIFNKSDNWIKIYKQALGSEERNIVLGMFLLQKYGGFFMNQGIKIIRELDDFLLDSGNEFVIGLENEFFTNNMCTFNVMGSIAGNKIFPVIRSLFEKYGINSSITKAQILAYDGITILPSYYLNPLCDLPYIHSEHWREKSYFEKNILIKESRKGSDAVRNVSEVSGDKLKNKSYDDSKSTNSSSTTKIISKYNHDDLTFLENTLFSPDEFAKHKYIEIYLKVLNELVSDNTIIVNKLIKIKNCYPKRIDIIFYLGLAYRKLEMYDLALSVLKEGFELIKKYPLHEELLLSRCDASSDSPPEKELGVLSFGCETSLSDCGSDAKSFFYSTRIIDFDLFDELAFVACKTNQLDIGKQAMLELISRATTTVNFLLFETNMNRLRVNAKCLGLDFDQLIS